MEANDFNLYQMNRAQIVDYYIQKIDNKEFDIYQLKKELKEKNIEDQEIKVIAKLIDNEIQRRLSLKSNKKKAVSLIYIGLILTFIGAFITVATYTNIIEMQNNYLIVYGPFFTGLSILFIGIAKSKK